MNSKSLRVDSVVHFAIPAGVRMHLRKLHLSRKLTRNPNFLPNSRKDDGGQIVIDHMKRQKYLV